MGKTRTRAIVWLASFLACCACAFALDRSLDVSQYAHTSWKNRDGFAKGAILSIAQTPDGYIWLGTEFGLVRFDGVRAVPWQPPSGQHLPSSNVAALLATRDGTLWIGTFKGLASWKGGKLTQYPELAGLLVRTLLEDHEGIVWVGGFAYTPPGKLCAIQNSRVQCYGEDGTLGTGVLGLYEDSKGMLWAGGLNGGFWRWKPGPSQFYPLAGELYGIQYFAEDDSGRLLIPIGGRVVRLADGKIEVAYLYPGSAGQSPSENILRDRDGGLWIGTNGQGLVHVNQAGTDTFAQTDGLSGDVVSALFEDREGSIWVGTSKGLDRFRAYSVATFSEREGMSSGNGSSSSVLAARDGSVWFSASGRLSAWHKGQVTIYHQPGIHPEPAPPAAKERVRQAAVMGLPKHDLASLFQDSDGRIWIAANGGVGYLHDDRFIPVNNIPAGVVYATASDAQGNLWISNLDRGLVHLFRGKLVQEIPWDALGRKDVVTSLAADPSHGGLWLGFSKGGLAHLRDGQIHESYTAADGVGEGRVSDLRFDHEGALWVATEGGISRIKDGHISTLTTKNGLPCDGVAWLIEDEDHALWFYATCGLGRIARFELDAWAADKSNHPEPTVQATVFDNQDGVAPAVVAGSGPRSRASTSSGGKIWFSTVDGLSVVDPRHLAFNKLPPPVHIEQIVADGKTYDLSDGMRLPPRVRNLQIDYTALSLVVPEKVHFRFKLEGQDMDWREVVNQRRVEYSNLPPRHYRFRVMACNNSGVWNEEGAVLEFAVDPAYWQTNWFRALCGLAILTVFWTMYYFRVRALKRRQTALEQHQALLERHQTEIRALNEQMIKAQEAERMRISGELHDNVLQQITTLTLRMGKVRREVPPDSEAKATINVLQQQLIQIGTDIRHISHELHPALLQESGLPAALSSYCDEFSKVRGLPVSCETDASVEELSPGAALCLYRIAQEALGNAAKYSAAKKVEVRLTRTNGLVRLSVSDDGVGCAPPKPQNREGWERSICENACSS